MKILAKTTTLSLLTLGLITTGCKPDKDEAVPDKENELEVITDIKLMFTNTSNTSDIVIARAEDPDGEGVEKLQIKDTIKLEANKTYTLTYEILNKLESPTEDIGKEIKEEDNEHQLFYGFTNNAFSNPLGNGNIDNPSDKIDYNDADENGNALGLSSDWATGSSTVTNGFFRVLLKHQPDIKTSTSGSNDGETDFDLSFVLSIN